MRRAILPALLLTSACNAPTPHFRGVEPVRAEILGSAFEMRRRDDLVEVVRISPEYAPRLGQMGRRAEIVVENWTGCPARWVRGDAALMLVRLKCGKPDDLAGIYDGGLRLP